MCFALLCRPTATTQHSTKERKTIAKLRILCFFFFTALLLFIDRCKRLIAIISQMEESHSYDDLCYVPAILYFVRFIFRRNKICFFIILSKTKNKNKSFLFFLFCFCTNLPSIAISTTFLVNKYFHE